MQRSCKPQKWAQISPEAPNTRSCGRLVRQRIVYPHNEGSIPFKTAIYVPVTADATNVESGNWKEDASSTLVRHSKLPRGGRAFRRSSAKGDNVGENPTRESKIRKVNWDGSQPSLENWWYLTVCRSTLAAFLHNYVDDIRVVDIEQRSLDTMRYYYRRKIIRKAK